MNNVNLSGYLASEPKGSTTRDGKRHVDFLVGCSRRGKNAGADFIACDAWGKTAEVLEKYFQKGKGVELSGKISVSEYDDKDGNHLKFTKVTAFEIEFPKAPKNGITKERAPETDGFDAFVNVPPLAEGEDDEVPFS